MNRNIPLLSSFFPVAAAVLAVAFFSGAATVSGADRSELLERESPALSERRETIEELRRELLEAEQAALAAGGFTDSELAERVLLEEDLLFANRALFETLRQKREAEDSRDTPVRQLQRALAEANTHEERMEILTAHRAVERVLATEESIQIRSTHSDSE